MASTNQHTGVSRYPDRTVVVQPSGMLQNLIRAKQIVESQTWNTLKRPRVVFVSLPHLFWSYQSIPMDVLCTSLFIFRCKKSWLFDRNRSARHVSIHFRPRKSGLENLMEKMRLDENFMELLKYKTKHKEVLWLEPNADENKEDASVLANEALSCASITPTDTGNTLSPVRSSLSRTQTASNEFGTKDKDSYYWTPSRTGTLDNSDTHALGVGDTPVLSQVYSGVDMSTSNTEPTRFVPASPAHSTTPYSSSASMMQAACLDPSASPSPSPSPSPNVDAKKEERKTCDLPPKGQTRRPERRSENSTSTARYESQPALSALDNAMKALFRSVRAPDVCACAETRADTDAESNDERWERVSDFVCAFRDPVTDEYYERLTVDATWWKWKIDSNSSKALRQRRWGGKTITTTTLANETRRPFIQKLRMRANNPFIPELVKTQIVNVEAMLNLMEHCNDLAILVAELRNFEGHFHAFAEVLHQSNPTLVPMITFDATKFWVKCMLLNACFHNLYYDAVDYQTQVIDPMYDRYELPIAVLCDKNNAAVCGDEFDKDCTGFVFVRY